MKKKLAVSRRSHDHVAIDGVVDASNATELDEALNLVAREKPARLVCDCRGLEFISSAGIGVLMALNRTLQSFQGVLEFVNVRPEVYQTFELLGLHHLFSIQKV